MENDYKGPPPPLTRQQEAEITSATVSAFAYMMQDFMATNADKPGWHGDTPESLLVQVNKHIGRVAEGLINGDTDDAFNSCVHAANFLMMVADNLYRPFGGCVGVVTERENAIANLDGT